jgi:peptidoglycan/LPS O-acetylase OafA/YrhL
MRNPKLDVLRCAAILLVLLHHSGPKAQGLFPVFARAGWAGVDLFFVLSGFLISGLLFVEMKRNGQLRIGRFLLRRGFKIYPSFYVFLLLAGVAAHFFARNMTTTLPGYLHEIFFVQNYFDGVWGHTWSLAVEEHFYVLLPLFLVFLGVDRIPKAFLVIAAISVLSRGLFLFLPQKNIFLGETYGATNSRMDALFFGVVIGYFYHYHGIEFKAFVVRRQLVIAFISSLFLSTVFIVPRETVGFALFGYTLVYLGFGGALVLALFVWNTVPRFLAPIAFLGTYSYSIYLWHAPVAFWLPSITERILHVSFNRFIIFPIYLLLSFAIGILMSRLVEFPMLRLRDKLVSQQGTSPAGTSGTIPALTPTI